jgi:hypothetical protein
MELTNEKIAEITAEAATKAVEEYKAKQDKEIVKRFTPGTDDVKVGQSPEDAIVASKLGGFKSAGHFYNDVIKAEKGGKSETLRNWENAVAIWRRVISLRADTWCRRSLAQT